MTITIGVKTAAEIQVRVPPVVTMTMDSARSMLIAAGFNPVFRTTKTPAADQWGKALTQSPAGNSMAPKGSTVTVVIGAK